MRAAYRRGASSRLRGEIGSKLLASPSRSPVGLIFQTGLSLTSSLPRQRHWLVVAVTDLDRRRAERRDHHHPVVAAIDDLMDRVGGGVQGQNGAALQVLAAELERAVCA